MEMQWDKFIETKNDYYTMAFDHQIDLVEVDISTAPALHCPTNSRKLLWMAVTQGYGHDGVEANFPFLLTDHQINGTTLRCKCDFECDAIYDLEITSSQAEIVSSEMNYTLNSMNHTYQIDDRSEVENALICPIRTDVWLTVTFDEQISDENDLQLCGKHISLEPTCRRQVYNPAPNQYNYQHVPA